MYSIYLVLLLTLFPILNVSPEKFDVNLLNDYYTKFLNFGDKKMHKINMDQLENDIFKSKIDVLGTIFRKNIDMLKTSETLDIVFLIDASSSVGENNFKSELKFVKKILSDVTVDANHTRVAVVTFSSPKNIVKNVDEISQTSEEQNKCTLLNTQLNNIEYSGGETFTIGAFQIAKEIFESAKRNNSKKALFLITDGYSNGGDPIPLARELKNNQVMIFTIGIASGNYKELYELSSAPGEFYSYLLDSFKEFESLARRALHVDLTNGDYIPVGKNTPCDILCQEGDCCDSNALCTCGTTTGHYACVCQPGYYGSGLKNSCLPCIPGTYSGGPNLCLPCPDAHHVTTPPAFGLDSCKCKEGYRTGKNNECKVVKCQKIATPEHGYFVKKKECINVFNSACGVRCEVGYSLVGSSIRLCQLNATWSGNEPTCEVKTCPQLSIPKFGKIKCMHPDLDIEYDRSHKKLPLDTVCNFECEPGKLLIGSRIRTCLPLSRWDGLKTTCKSIKCNKLPPLKFGKMEPSSCTFGKQEFGKTCKIICKEGFKITGPDERKCIGGHGAWDRKIDDTTCADITPPVLICPKNVTINTLRGKKYGQIVWQPPTATDNSGLEVSVWLKPAIHNMSSFKFQIGDVPVTYFAQDAFRNTAKCTFYVSVKDIEPPVIENCVDPPPFLINSLNGDNITWDEPYIYDNSQKVKVNRSHEFGYFKIGTTPVTYTAVDASGNSNVCKINITLEETHCEFLPTPSFGQTKCNDQDDGVNCVLTCQEGYAIPIAEPTPTAGNTASFTCNNTNPVWYNEEGLVFPECSVTSIPEESIQDGEITITPEVNICNDTTKLKELKNYIETTLNNEICIGNCTIDTKTECETESEEETSNKINRKRSAPFEEVPHRSKNRKQKKKINMKFQVRGKYLNSTRSQTEELRRRDGYNFTVSYNKLKFICPPGFIPRKNRCVQCPKGTFQSKATDKCQSCWFGTYNDKLGQTECLPCPLHHSTKKLHSKKATDCKEECPPGTYALKKYLKYSKRHPDVKIERATLKPHCTPCPLGQFQSEYGQLKCVPCVAGYTTTGVGSNSSKHCIPTAEEICKSNKTVCGFGTCVVVNEYEYSCNCSENYVGTTCDKFINDCTSQPCQNGGTCNSSNELLGYTCVCKQGYTGKHCEEEIISCGCLNNGTCFESDDNDTLCLCQPGYGGDLCEISINYCSEPVCENNSTCVVNPELFKCMCSKGFIGRRCNILPCDYKPCGEFAICVNNMIENATRKDYSCVCPEGYTGEKCDVELNHCQSTPCLNGGTCKNSLSSYSCKCTSLYYGPNCEYKRETDYLLHFQQYNTHDYVQLGGFVDNLTQITACLWMQTSDNFNYGTLLSYATRGTYNAFTLTDYTGLVLYVNNKHVVTDVLLNDGHWHHVCTTWESKEGSFKVYIDGTVIKNGTGLSTGTTIGGLGKLIIGQEQDSLGGHFSMYESFIGKIGYVDVWSRSLQDADIMTHFKDCNETFFGNLYAWPEMQDFVNGGVQVIKSGFCGECQAPKAVVNGAVDVAENVARYTCNTGFELNIKEYVKGRKCSKATKWEGLAEPYCKRVFCGYPGFVKNGYQMGSSYYYQDRIVYSCYSGFNMTGNNTIVCDANGVWTPAKPECIGTQCTAFEKPLHSGINILAESTYNNFTANKTRFDVGTQMEIVCHSNADLQGESIITCTDNGTWDYAPPKCVEKNPPTSTTPASLLACPANQIPASPTNGYIDVNSLYAAGNGTTNFVEYKCRPGYRLVGDKLTTCIIDGYWTQPNISCLAITCREPKLLANMILKEDVLVKKTYYGGNMISFQCEEGYSMFGKNIIRCMPNGRWSKIEGKCIIKFCRKPNVEGGATVQGRSFVYKNVVKIVCPNGSSYNLTCNKYGVWEGEGSC